MLIENTTFIRIEADIWTGRVSTSKCNKGKLDDKALTNGALRLINPECLKPFYALKAQARRLLNRNGVQIIEGSYGIPPKRHDNNLLILSLIERSFAEQKANFLMNYEEEVKKWQEENLEYAKAIQEHAPEVGVVAKALEFEVIDYNIGYNSRLEQKLLTAIVKKTFTELYDMVESASSNSDAVWKTKATKFSGYLEEVAEYHTAILAVSEIFDQHSWCISLLQSKCTKKELNKLLRMHQAECLFQFEIEASTNNHLPRGRLMF